MRRGTLPSFLPPSVLRSSGVDDFAIFQGNRAAVAAKRSNCWSALRVDGESGPTQERRCSSATGEWEGMGQESWGYEPFH